MNRTATQVITRALRVCKAIGADQSPASFALSEGFLALQSMLDTWAADPQLQESPTYVLPTFADLVSTVSIPDGLTEAIECGLAIKLASEHGTAVDQWVQVGARRGLAAWRTKVAALQVPNLEGDVSYAVSTTGGGYNILTDQS